MFFGKSALREAGGVDCTQKNQFCGGIDNNAVSTRTDQVATERVLRIIEQFLGEQNAR